MKKKNLNSIKHIVNRRARFDYNLGDSIIVGIVLNGAETKCLRLGHGQLNGAYIIIKDSEVWLVNSVINSAPGITIPVTNQNRNRKLLLKRKEIDRLLTLKNQGLTIIPLEILTGGHYIKLRIATGKGNKQFDKRQVIKKRDVQRDTQSTLKQYR